MPLVREARAAVLDHEHLELSEEQRLAIAKSIWEQENVELTTVGIDIGSSGTQLIFSRIHLRRLGEDIAPIPAGAPEWTRAELAGRLGELSAGPDGALLSVAMSVVLDAQLAGDPVAWVSATAATFSSIRLRHVTPV